MCFLALLYPIFKTVNLQVMFVKLTFKVCFDILTFSCLPSDQDGFSKGHFVMDSDTFSINSQGVISLKSDTILDTETTDSYNIEVQNYHLPLLNPTVHNMFRMTIHCLHCLL